MAVCVLLQLLTCISPAYKQHSIWVFLCIIRVQYNYLTVQQQPAESTIHLLPFMLPVAGDDDLRALYQKVKKAMMGIHNSNLPSSIKELEKIASDRLEHSYVHTPYSIVCVCVCVCVFYGHLHVFSVHDNVVSLTHSLSQ